MEDLVVVSAIMALALFATAAPGEPAHTATQDQSAWVMGDPLGAGSAASAFAMPAAALLVATVNFPFVTTQNFSLWACR